MKTVALAPVALALALLAGCASVPVVPLPRPADSARSEVLIYRESSFIASGVGLTVGTGAQAFAVLANSEYVQVSLPAGTQDIYVQARTAKPTRVALNLSHGARACLRTSASPSTAAKVLVPITLIATGYHFYLDEVPCPSADMLAKYKVVPVSYASP